MSDWQTIDNAPRDGTEMLLWSPMWEDSWGIVIGHFEGDGEGGGEWVTSEGECDDNEEGFDPHAELSEEEAALLLDDDFDTNMGPTHWFAIPAPPANPAEG